ncbi:MAG TPA: HPF/RaiA family ribosome-associated protein [Burkholderiales bacterium]|nr:HPF/RaiA family ribosome-associated protein [Burkholderiales bacterium]
MNVLFESHAPHAPQLRESAIAQVHTATRRLRWLIADVKVCLSTISVSPGRAGERCEIELDAHRLGRVVITSIARDPRVALDSALRRAARVLVRIWRHSLRRRQDASASTAGAQGRPGGRFFLRRAAASVTRALPAN